MVTEIPDETRSEPTPRDALQELKGQVERRLGGRIRNLQIVAQGLGLVLRGRTCTYYAKQLTQHAVMELTEFPILANEIDVC
jgi:hypothetical protein